MADNATLYGVCLHVPEIVQRPPGILGISSPVSHPSGGCRRFLVSAPRCYCVLTRVPFFELHYEMLNRLAEIRLKLISIGCLWYLTETLKFNVFFLYPVQFSTFYLSGCSIIAQERLNRITKFVSELTLTHYVPSVTKLHDHMNGDVDSPERESCSDWMASAIPVDNALPLLLLLQEL